MKLEFSMIETRHVIVTIEAENEQEALKAYKDLSTFQSIDSLVNEQELLNKTLKDTNIKAQIDEVFELDGDYSTEIINRVQP